MHSLELKVLANMAKWRETTMPFEVDMVEQPPHYNTADIECIDAMKAMSEHVGT